MKQYKALWPTKQTEVKRLATWLNSVTKNILNCLKDDKKWNLNKLRQNQYTIIMKLVDILQNTECKR